MSGFGQENLPPPPVSFALQLPDEIDAEEVLELLEVLQQNVPEFDELLIQACQTIEAHETNQEVQSQALQADTTNDIQTVAQNITEMPNHSNNMPESEMPLQQNNQPLDISQNQIANVSESEISIQQNIQSPSPVQSETPQSRFKNLDDNALLQIEKNQYSEATKKNTKWGIGVFNAWCLERLQQTVDFNIISEEDLNEKLRKFYAEAQPKNLNKRVQNMPENIAQEYHKNTLKSVRAAINRHLKDIGRSIDIVRDKNFKLANSMLSAKLKFNLRNGLSRPTQHYPIIPNSELQKINMYLSRKNDVVALRFKVWYVLAIHFVSRGIEFHPQLNMDSIKFVVDEESREYMTITHETHQKNYQGGTEDSAEEADDKRMYANASDSCPVKAVKLYISKCDPDCKSLFNQCSRDALHGNPEQYSVWYTPTPVKVKAFSSFMPDICKNAGIKRYTAHSLRATTITAMSDAGLTDRNIMFMSDHKCEESLKTYVRRPSNEQKHKISAVLDNVATGSSASTAVVPINKTSTVENLPESRPSRTLLPLDNMMDTDLNLVSTEHPLALQSRSIREPLQHVTVNSQTNQELSNMSKMSGFAANSSFHNCTFHFN